MRFFSTLVALATCTAEVFGMVRSQTGKMHFHPPTAPAAVPATSGNTTFKQLLDHDNPSLGTFSQRFWWNDQYWAGPGSPVVIFTPGEISADGYEVYLTNETITGACMLICS